jgi:hypothetical protein
LSSERRSGEDRREQDRETPERRKPGRPKLSEDQVGKSPSVTVVVSQDVYDKAARIALKKDISLSKIGRIAFEKLIKGT